MLEPSRGQGVSDRMRSFSPLAAVLVVAVLALLLVSYVFGAGGGAGKRDAAPESKAQPGARCSSGDTSELLKRELFGRAAALRGRDQPAMAQAARFSAVRISSAKASDVGRRSVTCSGTLALDLPPNMAVVGGRRSLTGTAQYRLETDASGRAQLRLLSNPDAIVTPLAALTVVPNEGPANYDVPAEVNTVAPEPAAAVPPAPRPPPSPPAIQRPQRTESTTRRPPPPPQRRTTATPTRRPPPPPPAKEREVAARPDPPAPRAQPTPPPSPPRIVGSARPSFDCRRARARSEIAVCSDAGLAALDRQMSAQFFSALRAARPGQRALLQRSRNRFLAFRNGCGSNACIAQAYRERMREIDDIMTGGF